MSLWGKDVNSQFECFNILPLAKLLTFAIACLDHALTANYPSFSTTIDRGQLQIVRATLDRLWSYIQRQDALSDFEASLANLYSIIPGEDDPEDLIPGWYYTIAALTNILRGVIGSNVLKEVMNAADAADPSICEKELNRAMLMSGHGLCGEEITEAERASPICREEIAFQLRCSTAIENDRPITRINPGV